jgi:hypothetical protein
MAKAILEFDLPEETVEYKLAVNAGSYYSVLFDMDQHLRSRLKYGGLTESEYVVLEKAREELHDLLSTYNVTLDL